MTEQFVFRGVPYTPTIVEGIAHVTREQAQEMVGCTDKNILRLLARGKLRGRHIGPARRSLWLIEVDSVLEHIRDHSTINRNATDVAIQPVGVSDERHAHPADLCPPLNASPLA